MSILAYFFKHSSQIEALLAKGNTSGGSHVVLDLLTANLPFIKRTWPQLNENDLLDDTVTLLKEQMAPQSLDAAAVTSNQQT